ncbi:MAG: succinylglutamate desuccinylase/aspartoacylase family protein [candidate division WOR-3 bacterium]|nr:MAG: succinylglutamate desuccinylase/aspartoacylase family protein [candidate division WOR-3 bacterium]
MKYIAGFILLVCLASATDLDLVRINAVKMDDIKSLDRNGVIINQVNPDHIVAEISGDMYRMVRSRGFDIEVIQKNITEIYRQNSIAESSRSQYLTYDTFVDSMIAMATNYPAICRLDTLGYSHQNRLLLIMKISDNVEIDEVEPEVHFEANVHGDEKIGWAVSFWMIRYLLENYPEDTLVQRLVDTREIWIAPMVNPDGFAAHSRYNGRSVDLNRNWGWMWGDEWNCGTDFMSENEARRFVEHFWRHSFVTYVSFHAGTIYISEPWSYTSYMQPPEQNLLHHLSQGYAYFTGYPYGQGSVGMYSINGCTKDYDYGCGGEMGWSIEVCYYKTPSPDSIDPIFDRDRPAMLRLMHKAGQGIHGYVYDSLSVEPTKLRSLIYVGPSNWRSYSRSDNGDFHRFYLPGTYSVTVLSPGYEPKTIDSVVVPANTPDSSVYIEVGLIPNPELPIYATELIGTRYVTTSYNMTYPVKAIGPHDDQSYQVDGNKWIVLGFDCPIRDYPGNDMTVYRSTGSGTATVKVSNVWYGPWQTLGTANEAVNDFDINTVSLDSARYVRIEASSTFMLDAVEALQAPTGITKGGDDPELIRPLFEITPTVLRKGDLLQVSNSHQSPVTIRLFNLLGQQLRDEMIEPGMSYWSMVDLPAGIYFLAGPEIASARRIVLID